MASEAQKAANRANAQRSTGPKTQNGKRKSSRNALRHGLSARSLVVMSETIEDYEDFRAAMRLALQPQDAVEDQRRQPCMSGAPVAKANPEFAKRTQFSLKSLADLASFSS